MSDQATKKPSNPNVVVIDARAATYDGDAVRVLAATFVNNGKIKIQRVAEWKEQPINTPNTLVVTDTPNVFRHWGMVFDEREQMREVMASYKSAVASNLLLIDPALKQYDPRNVIQTRKVDDKGRALDFDSMGINNGHIAILLAVWAARKAHGGYVITRPSEQLQNDAGDDSYDMMPFSI